MREHWFVRMAGAVADFSDPFYAEERQRDVWNEGSTFALMVLTWGLLAVGSVGVWIGDRQVLPYAIAMYLLMGLGGWLRFCYARCRGVRVRLDDVDLRRPVVVATLLMLVVYIAGLTIAIRKLAVAEYAGEGQSFGNGFMTGAVVGLLVWLGVWTRATIRRVRAERRGEQLDILD